MQLKRHFEPGSIKSGTPKVSHVDVLRHSSEWRPSKKIVARGQAEGWLTLDDSHITIITGPDDPDPTYKIVAPPGTYCCHCGERLDDKPGEQRRGATARAHVESEHKGKKSPSAAHPAGYAVHHFFMCEIAGEG